MAKSTGPSDHQTNQLCFVAQVLVLLKSLSRANICPHCGLRLRRSCIRRRQGIICCGLSRLCSRASCCLHGRLCSSSICSTGLPRSCQLRCSIPAQALPLPVGLLQPQLVPDQGACQICRPALCCDSPACVTPSTSRHTLHTQHISSALEQVLVLGLHSAPLLAAEDEVRIRTVCTGRAGCQQRKRRAVTACKSCQAAADISTGKGSQQSLTFADAIQLLWIRPL